MTTAYYAKNKEKELARQKAKREADPEKWRAIARKRYADNREKVRAYHKAYREAHKERMNQAALASYYRCKEKKPIEALRAQWREQKKREYHQLTPEQKAKRHAGVRDWLVSHPDAAKRYHRRDYLVLKAKVDSNPEAMAALRQRRRVSKQKVQADPVRHQKLLERRRRNERPQVITAARRKYLSEWAKNRRRNDLSYRIGSALRSRIKSVLRGRAKAAKTEALIGCHWNDFVARIESLWKDGMSWLNYGSGVGQWGVDHIKPCAAFDLSNPIEQQICFHYSNLQPLWHVDNSKKGSLWNGVRHRHVKKDNAA